MNNNMHAAITTGFDYQVSFEKAVQLIRGAGFETLALSSRKEYLHYDTPAGRARLRSLVEEDGVEIDSLHAPYRNDIASSSEEERKKAIEECKVCIDTAHELGIKTVVIHPDCVYEELDQSTAQKTTDKALQSVDNLLRYCAGKSTILAFENIGPFSKFVLDKIFRIFPDDHVGFCYDSGHENQLGECFQLLCSFGARLITTHIHDNHGSNDDHLLPHEGTIDWSRFAETLRGIAYTGNVLLEVSMERSQFKKHEVFLKEAKERADTLVHRITGSIR
jgi:sugar phosphate isomerase/epimerase